MVIDQVPVGSMDHGSILVANDSRIHHGVWQFRVSYWDMPRALMTRWQGYRHAERLDGSYHHGPPVSAPTGFTAHERRDRPPAGSTGTVVTGTSYDTRYTVTDADEWTAWKAEVHERYDGRGFGHGCGVHV